MKKKKTWKRHKDMLNEWLVGLSWAGVLLVLSFQRGSASCYVFRDLSRQFFLEEKDRFRNGSEWSENLFTIPLATFLKVILSGLCRGENRGRAAHTLWESCQELLTHPVSQPPRPLLKAEFQAISGVMPHRVQTKVYQTLKPLPLISPCCANHDPTFMSWNTNHPLRHSPSPLQFLTHSHTSDPDPLPGLVPKNQLLQPSPLPPFHPLP